LNCVRINLLLLHDRINVDHWQLIWPTAHGRIKPPHTELHRRAFNFKLVAPMAFHPALDKAVPRASLFDKTPVLHRFGASDVHVLRLLRPLDIVTLG